MLGGLPLQWAHLIHRGNQSHALHGVMRAQMNPDRRHRWRYTMIDVTFEIGGRKVSPNRFGDELERAVLKQVSNNVKRSLSAVCCPRHGRQPKVTIKGRRIDNLSWEVQGCCQQLIDKALAKLK